MLRVSPYATASGRSSSARDREQPFRSPKVVSIPVHFVGSENSSSTRVVMSESTASLKIQKVWRGFVVRKNMKKILGIKKEVDAIEMRISDKKTADLIRSDAKERLKVNEMLMALLFRLDSIRGVDLGVRDCRRRAIKKAIMLQDAIASIDADGETLPAPEEKEEEQMPTECSIGVENSNSGDDTDGEQDQCSEVDEGYLLVNGEDECDMGKDAMEVEPSPASVNVEDKVEGKKDNNNNEELMEKMIERNEILIGLVSDLCEKNKMQTQMINSLSNRVDHLEKSFRSRCKRRKQQQVARC